MANAPVRDLVNRIRQRAGEDEADRGADATPNHRSFLTGKIVAYAWVVGQLTEIFGPGVDDDTPERAANPGPGGA